MKSTSLAVLALIGEASAIKTSKAQYWASADDFDEPTELYQNMAQASTIANLDEDASDDKTVLATPEKADNDELSAFKSLNKKAEVAKAKEETDKNN